MNYTHHRIEINFSFTGACTTLITLPSARGKKKRERKMNTRDVVRANFTRSKRQIEQNEYPSKQVGRNQTKQGAVLL